MRSELDKLLPALEQLLVRYIVRILYASNCMISYSITFACLMIIKTIRSSICVFEKCDGL